MPTQIQYITGQVWQFCHERAESKFSAGEFVSYLIASPNVSIAKTKGAGGEGLVFIDKNSTSKRCVVHRRASNFFKNLVCKAKLIRIVKDERGKNRSFELTKPLTDPIWRDLPGVQQLDAEGEAAEDQQQAEFVNQEEEVAGGTEAEVQQMLAVVLRVVMIFFSRVSSPLSRSLTQPAIGDR